MSLPTTAGTTAPPTQPPQPAGSSTSGGRITEVVGDGTTARSRIRSRWLRARWPVVVVLLVVGTALLASVIRPPVSDAPMGVDNPASQGGRALAQILGAQGVRVEQVRTSDEALARAGAGTTLLVIGTYLLTDEQVDQLAETEADLVLAEPESWHVTRLTDGAVSTGNLYGSRPTAQARCTDPDATAAGAVRSDGLGLRAAVPTAVVCFPSEDDPATGAYVVVEQGSRRIVTFDDAGLMTNDRLDEDGNAALMLRTLGHHETLTWYIPSYGDTGAPVAPGAAELLPPWTRPLTAQLLLVLVALALWRGRSLGRIVTEPLPVTVRAAETTLGRGRLYRRWRSRGHAAAALRAGVARRAGARLGLPRTAGATDVIDALAGATGRSTEQVAGLLYGPPPTDDAALLQLARQLDDLESEVHRT